MFLKRQGKIPWGTFYTTNYLKYKIFTNSYTLTNLKFTSKDHIPKIVLTSFLMIMF